MLTAEERHRILVCISYIFSICLLPGRVKVETWEFKPGCDTKWRNWGCKTSYALFIAHALYKIGRLLSGFLVLKNIIPLHQVIIHLTVASCAIMNVYWYFLLLVKYPDLYLGIMKIVFSGSFSPRSNQGTKGMAFVLDLDDYFIPLYILRVTGNIPALAAAAVDSRRQVWYKRLLEYSPQDLMAVYLPYMILCSLAFVGACYIYDPTLSMLLYSALPERYQNWLIFIICFAAEMHFVVIIAGMGVKVLELQINTFDEITTQLEANITSTTNGYSAELHLRHWQRYQQTFFFYPQASTRGEGLRVSIQISQVPPALRHVCELCKPKLNIHIQTVLYWYFYCEWLRCDRPLH